jgi:glycosyltransferase involved in cell wall biosynthesis
MSISVAITTFNSEPYLDDLYRSLPLDRIDHLVIVNGGEPYTKTYDQCHWIQHETVKFASVARNDGLRYISQFGDDHIFIIEDDMVIKSPDIFDEYIEASAQSGIQYFGFRSNAWNSGPIGDRTPRISFQYRTDGPVIQLYKNTCNEFTYRSKKCIQEVGLYDERFQYTFDIEWLYRASKSNMCPPFWYFPDIANADNLVMNNPTTISRMNPNGERDSKLGPNYELFNQLHNTHISQVPDLGMEKLAERMNIIKQTYGK